MVWPVDSASRRSTDCFPSVHLRATTTPRRVHGAFVRSAPIHRTPRHVYVPGGTPTCSVRSLVVAASCSPRWRCRCCCIGNAATATTPSQTKLASATINGDGSTFQLGFNQVVIGDFKQQQKAVTINYQGKGSGTGRTDFVERGRRLRGHRRSVQVDRPAAAEAVPLLPDGGGADHGVVQPLGREAATSRRRPREDLLGRDHHLGRRGDQGRQPEGEAAEHHDHRRAPQ